MDYKSTNDMDKARFKIGQVSKVLNMSQQTIRYFEDKGLIVPVRDTENNHRYYSIYDIYKLTLRKQYKNIGISVSDTETIFKTNDTKDIMDLLDKHEKILEKERVLAELRVISIEKFKQRIKRIPTHLNRYFFMERPAFWKTPHITDKNIVDNRKANTAREIAIDLMPLSVFTFKFEAKDWFVYLDSTSEDAKFNFTGNWNLSIEDPFAEHIGFDKISTAHYVPKEEHCIYTIFKQKEKDYLEIEKLRGIMEFIDSNRLKAKGDIYGNIIISFHNKNGDYERYFEVWTPVTEV